MSAHYTLHKVLATILKLLAPITPFISEYIFQSIYQPSGSIHLELLPKPIKYTTEEDKRTNELMNLNSFIWKVKKDQGFSLKDGLKELYIPNTLVDFISDLKQMHNIETISFSHPDRNENIIQEGSFAVIFQK